MSDWNDGQEQTLLKTAKPWFLHFIREYRVMQRFISSSCLILASLAVPLVYGEEQPPQSLSEQLADTAKKSSTRLPPEVLQAMQQAIEEVRASGIEKSAKQVGDAAIDAELMGWNGEKVQLSELWDDGPIVLMWYRARACCRASEPCQQVSLFPAVQGTECQ